MKNKYTKKQIVEAIAFWENKLKMMNEASVMDNILPSYTFSQFIPQYSFDPQTPYDKRTWTNCDDASRIDMMSLDNAKKFLQKLIQKQNKLDDELCQDKNLISYRILKRTFSPKEQIIDGVI